MIRFTPDTWLDALMRVGTMALPQSNIYTEITAPESKPLICVAIVVVGSALAPRRAWTQASDWRRLGFVLLAMYALWLLTSGNGRYFLIPLMLFAVLLGCLARAFAANRKWALAIVVAATSFQLYNLYLTRPEQAWGQTTWTTAPGFLVDIDAKAATEANTYLSYAEPSFSIVAPQFSPDARWVNLAFIGADDPNDFRTRRVQEIISESKNLVLLLPTLPNKLPSGRAAAPPVPPSFQSDLVRRGLALSGQCRFLRSPSLTPSYKLLYTDDKGALIPMSEAGFWLCPLARTAPSAAHPVAAPTIADSVMHAVEALCPRFFPRGSRAIQVQSGVTVARYLETDMVLRVYASGKVTYQYYTNFQETPIGDARALVEHTTPVTCNNIVGRETMPWRRIR